MIHNKTQTSNSTKLDDVKVIFRLKELNGEMEVTV